MNRMHLRTRVLVLTALFAMALLAITFGLSWRARVAQERWHDAVSVQSQALDRRAIAGELPALERQAREMMLAGLAIAWILVICSFAAVQITLHRVVRPLEDLARAADRIADGDLAARAPVAGDLEIAKVATAFNHMTDKLRAHARTDELTALPNFRAFRERFDSEIDRAARYPERIGILVLDLDRFKQYNDMYGHLAGNEALQRVSHALRVGVRSVDFPARYGGEEFAVILPQIEATTLAAIAERIRAIVESLPAPANGAPLTISIGGALYPEDGTTVDALFHAADERLYEAKRLGRNRVIVATPARAIRLRLRRRVGISSASSSAASTSSARSRSRCGRAAVGS